MHGVFVTGTGTGVGKTVVAAAIARTLAGQGARVAVFKPALSGLEEVGEPDHALLRRASGSAQSDDEIAPYRYPPSVSPHLAAELAAERIEPQRLVRAAEAAAAGADLLVCEGVGGILVPLTLGYMVRDFARQLALPVVVAAGPGLGTINHTLLTLEAVRAVGLEVRSVVLTPWPDAPSAMERSNRDAIERLGEVPTEALPRFDVKAANGWPTLRLDRSGEGGTGG
jgi:dethiobiotin synthetase